MAIRVLVCWSDPLFGEALRALLQRQNNLEVLDDNGDMPMLDIVQRELPDVVVATGQGTEPAHIQAISQIARVILIENDADPYHATRALGWGVRAVLTHPTAEELLTAIRVAATGGFVLLPETMSSHVARAVAAYSWEPPQLTELTVREHEILRLLALGHTNTDIARKLFVSTSTVRSHVHHMLTKLGVHNRTQAVTRAYQTGLIESNLDGGRTQSDNRPSRRDTERTAASQRHQ